METSTILNDDNQKEDQQQQEETVAKQPVAAKRRRGIQIASDSEDEDENEDHLQIDESYRSPLKESRKSNNSLPNTNVNNDDDGDDEPLGNNRASIGTKRRSAMLDSDDDSNNGEEKENQSKKARVEETKENIEQNGNDKVRPFLMLEYLLFFKAVILDKSVLVVFKWGSIIRSSNSRD